MGEAMGWLGARRRWTVICAVCVAAVVGLSACSDDSTKEASCTGDEPSGVTVAGDDPPQWATSWVSQAGGAMGGGTVDVPKADDVLEAVYACTGLKNDTGIELVAVRGVAAERQVRIGVQDYAYRAGEMTVDGDRYSFDIAVAQPDSSMARIGIAFAPMRGPRSQVSNYSGEFVIQQMREAGVL